MFMHYVMYTRRRRKDGPEDQYLDTVDVCNSCYCVLSLMSSHPKNASMGGGEGLLHITVRCRYLSLGHQKPNPACEIIPFKHQHAFACDASYD